MGIELDFEDNTMRIKEALADGISAFCMKQAENYKRRPCEIPVLTLDIQKDHMTTTSVNQ